MDAEQEHERERDELVLAAAEDRLTGADRDRLERISLTDPGVEDDIAALRATLEAVRRDGQGWDESAMDLAPSPWVLEQALARTEGPDRTVLTPVAHAGADVDAVDRRPGRRHLLLGLAAAGLVAVGAAGGDAVRRLRPDVPVGDPGELGALEPLAMSAPGGAQVEAGLIAHTWGTETVLVVEGTDPGGEYSLVLVTSDGRAVGSGGFLGTAAPLDCEMNAAVLREDVRQVRILGPDGAVWSSTDLPAVRG